MEETVENEMESILTWPHCAIPCGLKLTLPCLQCGRSGMRDNAVGCRIRQKSMGFADDLRRWKEFSSTFSFRNLHLHSTGTAIS